MFILFIICLFILRACTVSLIKCWFVSMIIFSVPPPLMCWHINVLHMPPYHCLPNHFIRFVQLANRIVVAFLRSAVHYSVTFHSMMCWGFECWNGWFWSGLTGSSCYGLVLCVCLIPYGSLRIKASLCEQTCLSGHIPAIGLRGALWDGYGSHSLFLQLLHGNTESLSPLQPSCLQRPDRGMLKR